MNFNKFPHISTYFKSKPLGFTLIELLIVIGITATISTLGVSIYVNQQKAHLLETTAQEITNYLRYAQQKSVSQEQGLQWGVHFENPASGSDFYALYTGTTYSSPRETKYLPAGIEFQTPSSSNSVNISFTKLAGLNYSGVEQELIIELTSNQIARVIRATANGLITSGEGEKGYWKFDEGSGTTASDSTIYKNNGTLYNSPTWQSSSNCVSGTCLSFNGSNTYVEAPNNPSFHPTNEVTVSVWIKPSSKTGYQGIAGAHTATSYQLFINNNQVVWDIYNVNGRDLWFTGKTVNWDTWTHLVATYTANNGVMKVYINGVLVASHVHAYGPGLIRDSTSSFLVGWSGYGTEYYSGLIDEVRIYNRALSAAEILQHYQARK